MSYNWSLHSYDAGKLARVLVHSRQKVVDAVIAEMRAFGGTTKDLERHVQIGARLTDDGFSWNGWSAGDLKMGDRFAFALFHVCAEDIDFEPESPAFLSPSVTIEFPSLLRKRSFWRRPELIPVEDRTYHYLPLFTDFGRRLGEDLPSACEYIAFTAEETRALKSEIERFLASPHGESLNARYDGTIEDDLLAPVIATIRKGKALHAQAS